MAKYLNIALSTGAVTPLKISDVSTITVTGGDNFTLTYSDGGTAVLTSQAPGAAVFTADDDTTQAAVIRALWEQIIKGVATPWNLPVIGGPSGWDQTVSPAAPQVQGATQAAKTSSQLLGRNNAGASGVLSPFLSIV